MNSIEHGRTFTSRRVNAILIPIVGVIVNLIFVLLPSKLGPTRWNNRPVGASF